MNRIKIAALLIVLASCVVTNDKIADVETFKVGMSTGIVQGYLSDSAADVVAWDDIPFAQPPVGDLRWRATRPLTAANQIIRNKDDTACVQKASDYGGVPGEGIVGSEDCLYLDVKAPVDFKD
ncbi:MAG: carboxylesterase family protein, partial [Porticoccaceae bacterium]|nr:carboxylesterase family protein [Porticoccaceae bacterium]